MSGIQKVFSPPRGRLYGGIGARVLTKLFRNILDRNPLHLRGKCVAEAVNSKVLKIIDEIFALQGVGFHAEKVSFAGAVGRTETRDGPFGCFLEACCYLMLEVGTGTDGNDE